MWNKRHRLGLALGATTLGVSYHNGWGKQLQRQEVAHQFDVRSGNLAGLGTALRPLIDALPAQARRADTLVSVGLPDPLFQQVALRFDDFPKSDSEARALVCWRLCSELQIDPDLTAAGYQINVQGRDIQTELLAQSTTQSIVDQVTDQLWQSGLVPTSIDALSSTLCPAPTNRQAGAIYWQGGGWWCLRAFDDSGTPAPHFASWLDDDERGAPSAQVLRRIKRVMGAAEGAKSLDLTYHGVAPADLIPLADLAQEMSLTQTSRSVGSWQGVASLIAGGAA